MSKKSVWNKGKHNGGTGAKAANKAKGLSEANAAKQQEPVEKISPEAAAGLNRVNSVKRMNRDNWVSRPERTVNKEK